MSDVYDSLLNLIEAGKIKEEHVKEKKRMVGREKLVQKFLLQTIRLIDVPNLYVALMKAFDEGVVVKEIDEQYWLRYNRLTMQYIAQFSYAENNATTDWTVETIYYLALLQPNGESIKVLTDFSECQQARQKYMDKLATLTMKGKIVDDTPMLPKSVANVLPDDSDIWQRLIPKVAEYNHELADLLIYVRSCKGELKPSRKWGYVLVTEQLDEKNQNIYNETIRPKLAKHQEKISEILQSLV